MSDNRIQELWTTYGPEDRPRERLLQIPFCDAQIGVVFTSPEQVDAFIRGLRESRRRLWGKA